jgi:hypothetical protein
MGYGGTILIPRSPHGEFLNNNNNNNNNKGSGGGGGGEGMVDEQMWTEQSPNSLRMLDKNTCYNTCEKRLGTFPKSLFAIFRTKYFFVGRAAFYETDTSLTELHAK